MRKNTNANCMGYNKPEHYKIPTFFEILRQAKSCVQRYLCVTHHTHTGTPPLHVVGTHDSPYDVSIVWHTTTGYVVLLLLLLLFIMYPLSYN